MDFILALHSHLPWVLHHGRWPHGSDWLAEAAVDCYLPLLETLDALALEDVPAPITLGVTPVLANQLSHPTFGLELAAFFSQRLEACDEAEAVFEAGHEQHLVPIAGYWRERYRRLRRRFERTGGDLVAGLRRHASAGRIELISSAATHAFLPLLGADESILLQLAVGRAEHARLFGHEPGGCWLPECAYRPRGDWHPDPAATWQPDRPGIETHLAAQGYRYFFVDAHLAEAGRPLGLYRESGWPGGPPDIEAEQVSGAARRSPYRAYQVSEGRAGRGVAALVRDPLSTRQVWSRHGGFPGDGAYLEFHKIRYPGGLKFWRVTHPEADLGTKEPYEPNVARARAWGHAGHLQWLLRSHATGPRVADETVIVAPFDTELFGHWWHEGTDFIGDLYRAMATRGGIRPRTASAYLNAHPPERGVALAQGSWGANGDFSMWLNPATRWTWERLWPLERRFWAAARVGLAAGGTGRVLAQAARELLLLMSSDWQFIISTGAAGDYASRRFGNHADDLDRLLRALEAGDPGRAEDDAETMRRRDDLFPNVLTQLRAVLEAQPLPTAT
jgi:1,4-alpha-glucan branching enzyme